MRGRHLLAMLCRCRNIVFRRVPQVGLMCDDDRQKLHVVRRRMKVVASEQLVALRLQYKVKPSYKTTKALRTT